MRAADGAFMLRRSIGLLVVLSSVVLCTSFGRPASGALGSDAPPDSMAFVASSVDVVPPPREPTSPVPASAAQRAIAPTDLAIPLPVLPSSRPTEKTEIAIVPESLGAIDVFVEPEAGAALLTTLARFDEFDQPRVFRVVDERFGFYRVQVPIRPNGTTGWVRASDVEIATTEQRILIDLSDRSVVVWEGEDVVFDTTGTVGARATPTPTGSYYVRNVFGWYADSIYGPYVIPLSAYSEAIDQINGGDAVIAIHGTRRPDLMGQAASLGCVRLENDVLRQLAAIVEPGAPVEIVP